MKHRKAIMTTVVLLMVIAAAVAVAWMRPFKTGSSSPSHSTTPPATTQADDTLACVKALPNSIKIGQKLMVAGYSSQLDNEQSVFTSTDIGGVILMDAATKTQLTALKSVLPITPFVAVDQEGGTVQRYTAEGVLPGAEDMAQDFSADQAYSKYAADDAYLKSLGITTNFAPVVDVMSGTHNPLPGRMYSTDPAVVTNYASAAIKAAAANGITPVIKHFPGLGSASGNTDFGSATTDPLATLKTRDLVPYQQLVSMHPDVMVSNAIVPDLTNGQPAVWSPDAIKLLRSMGYQQAVVYSDSLTAEAIPGNLGDAVVKAWEAGIDVALIVQKSEQTPELASYLSGVIASANDALNSGALNSDNFSASVARILARKGVDACQLQKALNSSI